MQYIIYLVEKALEYLEAAMQKAYDEDEYEAVIIIRDAKDHTQMALNQLRDL